MKDKNKNNDDKTNNGSRRGRRAWPFLLLAIILALLAAETIYSCLYVLYLAFVKQERFLGLPLGLTLIAVFFVFFCMGSDHGILKVS